MLSVPAHMQPTLDQWKKTHDIGGMRFGGNLSRLEDSEALMDQVVVADNGPSDLNKQPGLIVCKDDGETIRFQGNRHQGSVEAVTAAGQVVAVDFTPEGVERLELVPENGGVQARQEHFSRNGGSNWFKVGGAVTVIDMDQPGALDQIFAATKPAEPSQVVLGGLAARLGVSPDQVELLSYETAKGMNGGNLGFPVQGELQMSAWTEGIEASFKHADQNYVYRGLDANSGAYGVHAPDHQGYWKKDERGIFVPAAGSDGGFGFAD